MKVLKVLQAKVIWLFDTRLINPRGLSMRDLFAVIKDRYQFAKAPMHEYDFADNKSLVFDGGVFDVGGSSISVGFTVFSDGIVAMTQSNTDNTATFVKDLQEFVAPFGFTIPEESSIRVGYASILDIEHDGDMLSIFPDIAPVVRFIEEHFSSLDGKPRDFRFAEIGIWSEDVSKNLAPLAFKFERRIGQSFNENRFWSQAPLQTNDHYELLGMLEKLFNRPMTS